jgi:hypothetical protein
VHLAKFITNRPPTPVLSAQVAINSVANRSALKAQDGGPSMAAGKVLSVISMEVSLRFAGVAPSIIKSYLDLDKLSKRR